MKRITCFTASLASGGAEHQMAILAEFLQEKGYEVTLVTCFDYPDHFVLNKSVKRVKLDVSGGRIQKELKVIQYFSKVQTDCIISFREQINFMVLIPMLFRPKIKVIVGERNLTVGRPTFYGWVDLNFLYKRADYIVCNNYSQEEYIKRKKYGYKDKLLTIINYTEIDKYTPSSYKGGNVTNIGIFCRYAKQKNYERLAKAIKIVKEKTDCIFKVHWYGAIPKQVKYNDDFAILKRLVDDLEINDSLVLHDSTKNVAEIMAGMDAICQPSIYEGFSNSLSEGISCGKIILAGNVSDNVLMVKDGFNGFVFDPYNVEKIANSFIRFLALDDDEKEQFGKNSRSLAESLFDKEKFVNSYIELIEK